MPGRAVVDRTRLLGPLVDLFEDHVLTRVNLHYELNRQWKQVRSRTPAMAIVERFVSHGDSVVDVGANAGVFTNWMASAVGAEGAVAAIEPNPMHEASLSALARRFPQVRYHGLGASDRHADLSLHVPIDADGHQQHWSASFEADTGAEVDSETMTVSVRPLDEIVDRRPVRFIKCDVEGHEDFVLGGARSILEDVPTLLIEIEARHRSAPVEAVVDDLARRGYSAYGLHGSRLEPIASFDVERDQLRYLDGLEPWDDPGPDYVNDFLFVSPADRAGLNEARPRAMPRASDAPDAS